MYYSRYKGVLGLCSAALLLSYSSLAFSDINWPAEQLLPSFSTPAQTQDHIFLREQPKRWEAEGSGIGHGTGHLDGDGWLAQTGVDAPNAHMLYGPYDQSIPAGDNTAEFRIKIDNNSAANGEQVVVDVHNASTGTLLAEKVIFRHDFNAAGEYQTFQLPFTLPDAKQAIELRVYWLGGAYIKVDWVGVNKGPSSDEMFMFASLKGLVNATQPRIFSYEGDAYAEGAYTWLESLGLNWTDVSNNWDLISKYRSEIDGIIVYDATQEATINLATTIAKQHRALVASPALADRLTAAPYNLPIAVDLRGRFTSKLQVYQTLYNDYWPTLDHRAIAGLSPKWHKASVREYAAALGLATIWLDPMVAGESELLNQFLQSMGPGQVYLGWWPDEGVGITRASQFGVATVASDYSTNLTMHSGMSRTINAKPIPAKPALQNKIYVGFILSDGDNLQFVEHLMRKLWKNPDRGSVPIGWTVSPAMVDAMPGALNFFHETATENDNLISGPSGYGYIYPNEWSNTGTLNQFLAKTQEYNKKAGLDVITVWNTIVGGINQTSGNAYARYAPQTLGLTAQNTGGGLTIYDGTMPGLALSCNYCTTEQAMIDHINGAAAGWDGQSPRFVMIQAQPWTNNTPTTFKNVANRLDGNYQVVRPDHLFQLLREAHGLPWQLDDINNNNQGLKADYFNGMNFETLVGSRVDANLDMNWDLNSPMLGVNADGFTTRWTGQIQPRTTGNYTFHIRSDNGRRVWVNNELIIDQWVDNWDVWYSGSIALNANEKYDIKVEYFENNGGANIRLEWESDAQAREVVPQSQLFPTGYTGGSSNPSFETLIEAESYSASAGVDLEATTDTNGGSSVGWIDTGDWMAYSNITIPESGNYLVEYRVASETGGAQLSLDINSGAQILDYTDIGATGGWQQWQTLSKTVYLDAGTFNFGIYAQIGGFNLNWWKISKI